MPRPDPFEVLGLEPTLDHAAIKRAYFTLLPRHAPHADPDGFRRLRDAYETLTGPELIEVWATANVDVERQLDRIERELGPRIADAKQRRAIAESHRLAIASFESLLRLDLASARSRARFDPK
jgi:curved DNA-binding protein CbpA